MFHLLSCNVCIKGRVPHGSELSFFVLYIVWIIECEIVILNQWKDTLKILINTYFSANLSIDSFLWAAVALFGKEWQTNDENGFVLCLSQVLSFALNSHSYFLLLACPLLVWHLETKTANTLLIFIPYQSLNYGAELQIQILF